DVVLIAGDVFHNVRPANPAILHAFNQFSRLLRALPDTPVVIIAGNHDTPRATETGCILKLFAKLGAYVVTDDAERISIPERELSILAVPDSAVSRRPAFDPDPTARYNVLLLHGPLEGVLPVSAMGEHWAAQQIPVAEIGP